jgi:hypothetical protein
MRVVTRPDWRQVHEAKAFALRHEVPNNLETWGDSNGPNQDERWDGYLSTLDGELIKETNGLISYANGLAGKFPLTHYEWYLTRITQLIDAYRLVLEARNGAPITAKDLTEEQVRERAFFCRAKPGVLEFPQELQTCGVFEGPPASMVKAMAALGAMLAAMHGTIPPEAIPEPAAAPAAGLPTKRQPSSRAAIEERLPPKVEISEDSNNRELKNLGW